MLRTFPMFLLALAPAAQVPTDTTIVLTRTAGPALAQVLAVASTGTVTPFARFPSDVLAPLAIEVDPYDRQVIVAVDLGTGNSRVVRLLPGPGLTFAGELLLADLPGRCEQLAVVGDDLLAIIGGNGGGILRLPRRGGTPVPAVAQGGASAMLSFGYSSIVILGWSGAPGPAPTDPGLVHVDTANGAVVYGPFPFTNLPGRQVTGLIDLPTGLSRQLVAFGDGSYWLHVGGLGDPTPVSMTPQPPPGGASAFKSDGYAFSGLAVGGAAYPHLYRADWSGTITVLATLPGDPVDLVPPLTAAPEVLPFGTACGAPALQLVTGVMGPPQVGNLSFDLRVTNALPGQVVVFVAGFSDVANGALPFVLPGGCLLQAAPDATQFLVANAGGGAQMPLPIPGRPALAGAMLFAQWLQPQGIGLLASPGAAVHVGL